MKAPQNIIVQPMITEKMEYLQEAQRKYAFKVHPAANKIEIRQAVEAIYNVTVTDVNVMNRKGKKRRVRYTEGRRSNWKKAVVTLKEGDSIEYFE
ncbi:MAG: 50S ribosomal protein L23 [candidate division Zixibacteria bacterium]|nr:50S ribosomal protein L23 [candidate division Zixibacteria bacterium]